MLESNHHKGFLIGDSTVPGGSKGDDVFPGQSNAIQVSKNRWLLAYATRGFSFIENDLGAASMESACSQFQDRLKRRGQFWSPRGLANMLIADVAVKNDTLQYLWNWFYNRWLPNLHIAEPEMARPADGSPTLFRPTPLRRQIHCSS